mgnify:CR=1 FL=1
MIYLFFIITILIIVLALIKSKNCREKDTKATLSIQLLIVALLTIIYIENVRQTNVLQEINQKTTDTYETTVAIGNHVMELFDEFEKFSDGFKNNFNNINDELENVVERLGTLEQNLKSSITYYKQGLSNEMAKLETKATNQVINFINQKFNIPQITEWVGE